MPECPYCHGLLVQVKDIQGMHQGCSNCSAHVVGLAILRREFDKETINALWQNAITETVENSHPCPFCHHPLTPVSNGSISPLIEANVCKTCMMMCLEDDFWQRLPLASPGKFDQNIAPEALEAGAELDSLIKANEEQTKVNYRIARTLNDLDDYGF